MKILRNIIGILLLGLTVHLAHAEVKVTVEHNQDSVAEFEFKTIPAPLENDLAAKGTFSIIEGESDPNGGGLRALNDGSLPTEDDQPARNFFFSAGSDGGRVQLDLGSAIAVKQVNSYSWHAADRGPQVYKLFVADGTAPGFNPAPKRGTAPDQCGWQLVASVDTRSPAGEPGGQYGVSISDPAGVLGKYRYFLFDISRTEGRDPFGNTFYSEIDVRAMQPVEPEITATASALRGDGSGATNRPFRISSADQYCQITIDTSGAPALKEWADQKLAPVLAEWYPKLVSMLPGDGFDAPRKFSVSIRPGEGVAATGGTRITANSKWLERELQGQAIGALVHEEVHVVQQYRGGRRNNPDFKRPPGWLVEGIPDYIRWFLYEPQSHGADAVFFRAHPNLKLNYDKLYRISANFLNYVIEHYGQNKNILTRVNDACRQGKYTDEIWSELTGKSLPDLNEEWKASLQKQIAG
jgi:hypothetical protein